MSLLLSPELPINGAVPKEYNLQITNRSPMNTYLFSERDLPGYSNRTKGNPRHNHDNASLPQSQVAPRPQFQDRSKQGSSRFDKNRKWEPYYRKAIPSKFDCTGHEQDAKGGTCVQRRPLSSVKRKEKSTVFLWKTMITTGLWTKSRVRL